MIHMLAVIHGQRKQYTCNDQNQIQQA